MIFPAFGRILVLVAAFFYSKFNVKSIEILIFPAFGNLCFKANSYIYIYIYVYWIFIHISLILEKKLMVGGVLTVRFRIYIYTIWWVFSILMVPRHKFSAYPRLSESYIYIRNPTVRHLGNIHLEPPWGGGSNWKVLSDEFLVKQGKLRGF